MKIDKPYKVKDEYIIKGPIMTNEKKVYASLNIIITDWANINDVDIVISDSEVVVTKLGVDITENILEVIMKVF